MRCKPPVMNHMYLLLCLFISTVSNTGSVSKHVICSSHKILELFDRICQVEGCRKEYYFNNTTIGCCLSISAQCTNGHTHKWLSSEKVPSGSGDIYQDNLDFAAALVLSGNHFSKFQQFHFVDMVFLSRTSFIRTNVCTSALPLISFMKKSR